MYGTPTHRRFEALLEPVDIASTVSVHDPCPVPEPWVGRDTPLELAVHDVSGTAG
jgi:hypothetical protein